MLRWPNVPAVYGWLALDRRARWRLRGTPVTHGAMIDWLNRQYGCNDEGCYFVQNGPQRVFVELEYTPWILHLAENFLKTHTGARVTQLLGVAIDEEGNLLLDTPFGLGLLDDRDLPRLLDCLQQVNGQALDETALLAPSPEETLLLLWGEQSLPVKRVKRAEVARQFGFVAAPEVPDR